MIGQMAENGGLNGFSLNLSELKKKLLPTTHFFGTLNERLEYKNTLISPDNNSRTVEVNSLPFRIGVRQLDIPAYPSRPFYMLDFNDNKLEDRVKGRLDDENDVVAVHSGVEAEKQKIRQKRPLKITIERDWNEDIEALKIEEITDNEGNVLNKNFFSLQVQSMSEVENFWLDSGIFDLTTDNSNM
jgi:hypothetical protein